MKFLILIILFFVALFVFIPTVLFGIIRFFLSMFGGGMASNSRGRHRSSSNVGDDGASSSYRRVNPSEPSGRKKVFDKNEGEYVNFEEIDKPSDSQGK